MGILFPYSLVTRSKTKAQTPNHRPHADGAARCFLTLASSKDPTHTPEIQLPLSRKNLVCIHTMVAGPTSPWIDLSQNVGRCAPRSSIEKQH